MRPGMQARRARTVVVLACALGALAGCRRADDSGLEYLSNPPAGAGGVGPGSNPPRGPDVPPEPRLPVLPPPAPSPPGNSLPPGDSPTPAPPADSLPGLDPGAPMPFDVLALLQARCSSCHRYGQEDQAGWGSVLDVSRLIAADIVVPGDPGASRMIHRVATVGDMPPTGDRLTADEVQALTRWIEALPRDGRPPLSDGDVLDAISSDQIRLRSRAADYRYLSLAHLLGEGRPAQELEATRALLVFLINSLSRRANLVELPAIDAQGSILRLRLSELGWDEAVWDALIAFYPYCARSDAAAHQALYGQLRTEAPVVRGDWLLATATRSPLYELLLDLPPTLDQLAQRLGLDITRDINHPGLTEPDNLLRVGLTRSRVAQNNRLVERHLGGQGQYLWLTYDFTSSTGRSDLLANPLGPAARDQQRFEHTFQHAASEAIFTLPNGLQGYLLVDAAGNRLSTAAAQMVRDARRPTGLVENGISCLGCHARPGILRPDDTDEVGRFVALRSGGFLARELDEIDASYPRVLRPDVFTLDAARYRATVGALSGAGAPAGEGEYTSLVDGVGQHESTLGLQGAAAELGLTAADLRARLATNQLTTDALPPALTAPLAPRARFVCAFRGLLEQLRPDATTCAGTFIAPEVRATCTP
jgi:hypothetical protein